MLCCVCKEKPASVHLTEIKGDKVQKVDLCEACAKNKGVNDSSFALADLLLGLGAYAILKFSEISLTAALVGLFVSTAAVILEILIELIYART